MRYSNTEIAQHLTDIATAHEIKKSNSFRISAYENAAEIVASYHRDIYQIWQKNPADLDNIPGFGQAITQKVDYFLKNSRPHPSVIKLFKNIHPAVFTFTKINGIGPIIAHNLTSHLKFPRNPFKALEKLLYYAQKNKLSSIPGLGEKSQESILDNTLSFLGRKQRMPFQTANKLANKIMDYLKSKFPKIEFVPLGSLRRKSETVGDIDIAAASDNPRILIDHFVNYPESIQTIATGKNKASIRLSHDIHVDLMIKPADTFGSLLQHFTGSKLHNINLRRYAQKLGFSLSEYGIKDLKTGKIHRFGTEKDFYNFLGLDYIPPEKRIGENELQKYKMV